MLKLRSKVGPKGQVVIPKPIRDSFDISSGEEVYFHVENHEIIIEAVDGEKILEEYLEEIPDKVQEPKSIDWEKEYSGRYK